jgi:hypothetical protein
MVPTGLGEDEIWGILSDLIRPEDWRKLQNTSIKLGIHVQMGKRFRSVPKYRLF